MIKRYPYSSHNQEDISLFVLENKFLKVSILDYGATITSIIYKPLDRETVLGLRNFEDYRKQKFYLGALVGRVANRINSGKFALNNITYHLSMNGTHHLHGGKIGFDQQRFNAEILGDSLILTHFSKDGDQGYPGNLDLQVVYTLDKASLVMTTSAISDQDTLFDSTQHTYFNLNQDKSQSILNHTLKLNSECLYEIAEDGCTGSQIMKTEGSPFDFRSAKPVSDAMDFDHPQIKRVKGIDQYFIKQDFRNPQFCECSVSDLTLTVSTTLPGAHIYTGNYLGPIDKKNSYPFLIDDGGLCFETQHVPNSINFDQNEAPIIRANTMIVNTTIYTYNQGEHHGNHTV
jgi:aldose 1-epimerase